MNEKINLCEILEDCPRGVVFYSPIFGNVSFEKIIENCKEIMVITERGTEELIHSDATVSFWGTTSVEPMLYPSKTQRDWSKWKCPKPKFDPKSLKAFDRVIVKPDNGDWHCSMLSHKDKHSFYYRMIDGYGYPNIVPYNDDTKHLVGTSDEAPEYYRYWED